MTVSRRSAFALSVSVTYPSFVHMVERIWQEEGLKVPGKQPKQRILHPAQTGVPASSVVV